jgi:hypothetical protein
MINKGLYKRLERLESRALSASGTVAPLEFINNGTPGGLKSVRGPDGRHVWWNPPEGCKVGELLEDGEARQARSLRGTVPHFRILLIDAENGKEVGPTTVAGPDDRLVWLEPPAGCKAGEPIEDSAGDPGPTYEAEPLQKTGSTGESLRCRNASLKQPAPRSSPS